MQVSIVIYSDMGQNHIKWVNFHRKKDTFKTICNDLVMLKHVSLDSKCYNNLTSTSFMQCSLNLLTHNSYTILKLNMPI